VLYAISGDGEKVIASPRLSAYCPGCKAPVVPRCGEVNIWHWAHHGENCDPWSYGKESDWHLIWKSLFYVAQKEKWIDKGPKGKHRADVFGACVIEFQSASLPPYQIRERESFYEDMIWVYDAIQAYEDDRIILWDKGDYQTFRIKWPRRSIFHVTKRLFLDLGDQSLFEVRKMYEEGRTGWGYVIDRAQFLAVYDRECAYEQNHASI